MYQETLPRKASFLTLLDLSEKCESSLYDGLLGAASLPRVAIIGAGITGVSTACNILDCGLDCQIFEARGNEGIGGIWTRVNETSSLQIHSKFYRFHPKVTWKSDYPNRSEILGQVDKLWKQYDLSERTTFNCPVDNIYKEDGKWVINDPSNGYFDGIVAAVGTCGEMYTPHVSRQEEFTGRVLHSSQLSRTQVKDQNIVIVGGGASAVEALEYSCDNGAASVKVMARSERWFIPRHPTLNACLAATIGDKFGLLARSLEMYLRIAFYRDLSDMAPPLNSPDGIFSGTPIVNSRVFDLMRQGRASWMRGDVQNFTSDGVLFSRRTSNLAIGEKGELATEKADVCVMATGYRRPSLKFLPPSECGQRYAAPNWYLQTFPTDDATICATNCTWQDGIGTVGGGHIGIYTRFLLVFLLDPRTKPSSKLMKNWVDVVHFLKKPCPGGPLAFVTSAELFFWFIAVMVIQPSMWRWMSFVLFGPSEPLVPQQQRQQPSQPSQRQKQQLPQQLQVRSDPEKPPLSSILLKANAVPCVA